MADKHIEAHVSGRVQGVWYRAFVQTTAVALGLTGYVENLPDGRVHLVAVGDPERVNALLEALKEGPPGAEVERVDARVYSGPETFADFSIRY